MFIFFLTNRIGTDTFAMIETYITEQKARLHEDRYIHVSEREKCTAIFGINMASSSTSKVRTLDCDTTFKPVAEKTDLYEINAWMPGINEGISSFKPIMSDSHLQ
jgi:hypothetical protein